MGLIEKAMGLQNVAVAPPAPAREDGAPAAFDLDFGWLSAHGLYSPEDRASKIALELRAMKRNLLRRTGQRAASGDRRILRKQGRQRNLVLVTSARPSEGKTFCAVNLALSLAFEEANEIVLIDGDLPRPKIRSHFNLPQGPGLSDRIAVPATPFSAIAHQARQAPFIVIGEGRAAIASEQLATAEAQHFFNELSLAHPKRLILIDAPPVLATREAILLARHVDEVIFVVEADSTPHAAAASALDELLDANQNVNLVLNRCLVGAGSRYFEAYGEYGRTADAQTNDAKPS
jgi:Mrp family chromosome partitioning ATPase